MTYRVKRHLLAGLAAAGLCASPLFAQTPMDLNATEGPRYTIELLYTSSMRTDGAAEVTLSLAGQNGVQIDQERSITDRTVISKTILAPVASASLTHLSQTHLILERDSASNSVVLVLHPHATPNRSIRLILPNESTPRTGAISMGIIYQKNPGDPSGGTGGGGGCYPISYTSDRCGTITNCCPTTSVSINGVNCTITCN